jgi:hypothetical protein
MTLPSDVHEQIQEELVPIAGVIVNDLLIVVMAVVVVAVTVTVTVMVTRLTTTVTVVVVVVDLVGIPALQVPNNNQNFLRPAESDIQSVSVTDRANARGIPGWFCCPRVLKEGISQMPAYSE